MKALLVAATLVAASPALAQEASLPGGASSLSETHGSWSVNCALVEAKKDCGFNQTVGNPQTGSPLMGMELAAPAANTAEGMLLTAFGLRLDAGVQLGIDGQQLGTARPFLTCVPSGCLVPLQFDEVALSALKVGSTLEVTGVKVDDGQPVTVNLSLAGFTAAYERTAELAR